MKKVCEDYIKHRCFKCATGFREAEYMPGIGEEHTCSDCRRNFWSTKVYANEDNIAIVAIDPKDIDEQGHWV